jgi:formate--tetrahydrofolate ligase
MTNLTIAQSASLQTITKIAENAGLSEEEFESQGRYKAKLTWEGVERLRNNPKQGKLILCTAVSPTPAGEGKTTVTVGLSQALNKIGKSAVPAIREPALGPVFGIKGGACGGGYSQVLPMEDINLFFTGDFPAIQAAHNLLSAMLDSHIHFGNELGIDVRRTTWPRTMDMNDRALRQIVVGLGGLSNGYSREDGFVITAASEIMAIMALAESRHDLRKRLGNILVGLTSKGAPIRCRDLGVDGAMAVLLKDALRPNLVQTIEGGPAFVHCGPFANIAHGCSSIIATQCALGMSDYVVTEAGFASDLGAEKFLNIVAPRLGRGPDAIVLVATIRALKHHGGGELCLGMDNLARHLAHLQIYGPPVIVAINRFTDDTQEEQNFVKCSVAEYGAIAVVADPWNGGGVGCVGLAEAIVAATEKPAQFAPLANGKHTFEERLHIAVEKVYGGIGFELDEKAERKLVWAKKHGLDHLPICIAKTQYSLSDSPEMINAPTGFKIHVRDIRPSLGAGFLVAICGEMMLMPGLAKEPAALKIDIDDQGCVTGLF